MRIGAGGGGGNGVGEQKKVSGAGKVGEQKENPLRKPGIQCGGGEG